MFYVFIAFGLCVAAYALYTSPTTPMKFVDGYPVECLNGHAYYLSGGGMNSSPILTVVLGDDGKPVKCGEL